MNFEKLQALLARQMGLELSSITENSSFVDDLGADSLDLVEIVMNVEKEFGIKIEEDEAERCNTVGKTLQMIAEKQQHSAI